MPNEIIKYFPNTDLRCSHFGLTLVSKKAGIDVKKLEKGNFLVFVNSRKDAMKILTAGDLLVHYKSPSGRIDIRTLRYIPQAFSGTKFTYDIALTKVLEDDFRKRGIKV